MSVYLSCLNLKALEANEFCLLGFNSSNVHPVLMEEPSFRRIGEVSMENNLNKKSSDDGFDRTLGSFGLSVEFLSVFLSVCLPPILSFSLSHSQDHTLLLHLSVCVLFSSFFNTLFIIFILFFCIFPSSLRISMCFVGFLLHSNLFVLCHLTSC